MDAAVTIDPVTSNVYVEFLREKFRRRCLHDLAPAFWKFCAAMSASDDAANISKFASATDWLYRQVCSEVESVQHNTLGLQSLGRTAQSLLCTALQEAASASVPEHFGRWVQDVFSHSLAMYWELELSGESRTEEERMALQTNWASFCTALDQLKQMELLDMLCKTAVVETVHCKVKSYICERCESEFESPVLPQIEGELLQSLMKWLQDMPGFMDESSKQYWEGQFRYFSFTTFVELRVSKMFEIIVEYPESRPALLELKIALEHVNYWQLLTESLSQSYQNRLLHPGASTADILSQYISTMKSLHVVDPSGAAAERVCQPVQAYLRTREDTVRCIVASLIDDSGSDLADELSSGPSAAIVLGDQEEDDGNFSEWMPEPVGVQPGKRSQGPESLDIIGILVRIYGSPDLFVKEYCNLLADRLLASLSYDVSREVHSLEQLKVRFGETNLHLCDVMLKDIVDSRRINGAVSQHMPTDCFPVEGYLLSHCFWPAFRSEGLCLPQELQQVFDSYTTEYKRLKGLRTLEWKSYLGQVEVEVEVGDRTLSLSVSPPRAVIVYLFQEKDTWTISDLSKRTELSSSALRKHLAFWVSQGVLKETEQDEFTSSDCCSGENEQALMEDIEEAEHPDTSAAASQESPLQHYWPYIVGMLTNFSALPLDKMHSMLLMFADSGEDSTGIPLSALKRLLDEKVAVGSVVLCAGQYSLPQDH